MLTAGRNTVRKPCLLLDTHFPKNTHVVEDLYIEENLDDQSIDNISNPGRIQWAVYSFKPFKSPGPDGFFPAKLPRRTFLSLPWLTVIFHGCLALNHVPTRWLDVKVIFSRQTLLHQPNRLPPD